LIYAQIFGHFDQYKTNFKTLSSSLEDLRLKKNDIDLQSFTKMIVVSLIFVTYIKK